MFFLYMALQFTYTLTLVNILCIFFRYATHQKWFHHHLKIFFFQDMHNLMKVYFLFSKLSHRLLLILLAILSSPQTFMRQIHISNTSVAHVVQKLAPTAILNSPAIVASNSILYPTFSITAPT
jgi:hypothetical protein